MKNKIDDKKIKQTLIIYKIFNAVFFIFMIGFASFAIVGIVTGNYIWFIISGALVAVIFICAPFYNKIIQSKEFEAIELLKEGHKVDLSRLNDEKIEMPIPAHLKDYLTVDAKKSNEKRLYASLKCGCGEDKFKIEKSTNHCVVKAVCQKCQKEILVFDAREHGWDGYVCGLFRGEPSGPFEEAKCKQCQQNVFKADIVIFSKGKLDFIHNACQEPVEEAGRTFAEDEWVNAFANISIYLKCVHCNKKQLYIDYETM